ncbi:hypothetical protein HBI93_071730 [Parastagonospora nodorum]|nr:hypothetical protein HBI93_071730 [Parastagonospora nodorum]KAH5883294.1 hypothetical protein HBI91_018650 [Parastagonospora nodorum]KAH5974610.1 hypothetical protein HBI85_040790 [Parastagonospora nodorum]
MRERIRSRKSMAIARITRVTVFWKTACSTRRSALCRNPESSFIETYRLLTLQLLISFSSSDSVTITSRQSSAGSLRTVASSSELHAAGCRLCVENLENSSLQKDSDFIHLSARRTRLSLDSSLIIGASSRVIGAERLSINCTTGDVRLCCTTQQQRALRLLSATQSSILDESLKTSQANKLKINIAELSKNIRTYIRFCPPCLRNRTERHLPYGTLEPTQTPGFPFHIITIDLVTALPPETSGSDALMTVTSKHTKKVLLIPGMNDWSAAEWGASLVEGLIMHEWDLRHSIIKLTANLSAQTRQSKSPCDISLPREGLAAFCRDPTPRTSISSPGAIVERSRPRRRRTLVIVAGARSRLYQKALQKELVDDSSHSDSKMNEIRERIADLLWKNYCEATGRPL